MGSPLLKKSREALAKWESKKHKMREIHVPSRHYGRFSVFITGISKQGWHHPPTGEIPLYFHPSLGVEIQGDFLMAI